MKTNSKNNILMAWLLITPALLIFALMILFPFINSIFTSFTNKNLIYPKNFIHTTDNNSNSN